MYINLLTITTFHIWNKKIIKVRFFKSYKYFPGSNNNDVHGGIENVCYVYAYKTYRISGKFKRPALPLPLMAMRKELTKKKNV